MDIKESWTQSHSGTQFFPFNQERNKFLIGDIAHALALVNRYNGHTPEPYSVAQHSVYVSLECDAKDAFWGLMHDSSEAFIGDLISPIKKFMPSYVEVENEVMGGICRRFWMAPEMPASVKRADLTVLAAESRDLFPVKPADWKLPLPPVRRTIRPLSWRSAERLFLRRFLTLWPEQMSLVKERLVVLGSTRTERNKVVNSMDDIFNEASIALEAMRGS